MFAEAAAFGALDEALLGRYASEVAKVRSSDRFAHYTSRSVAEKIIVGDISGQRCLWLRNALLMNDFSEVRWGQHCLAEALQNWRLHDRFRRILDAIHPELYQRLSNLILDDVSELGRSSFLLSLTLHTEQECQTGKLSMWRAYGDACLVFNTSPFLAPQFAYELVLSPVMYGGSREFSREFESVIHRLEQRTRQLKALRLEDLLFSLKRGLDFAVLSVKHPGFHEEAEWRVIHQPSGRRPDPPWIPDPTNQTQRVYQVPMQNRPEVGLWGAELEEILDRIIVGPSEDAEGAKKSYVALLKEAGISNAEDRVVCCDIPLRNKPS